MAEYQAPLNDMRFVLRSIAGLGHVLDLDAYRDVDADTVDQVLEEAARFARDVLAPLNRSGDAEGCKVVGDEVVVADGFADAYRRFAENGWQALPCNPQFGGAGLPELVGCAAIEMWNSANLSLSLCPLLTAGAIVALEAHASDGLRQRLLPRLVSGEWTATMNLTEPQAGSDLAALATRAEPDGDEYRITGNKIFITWGEHPMADNIVHLVLARLPDAPAGVGGISLFAVPKFRLGADGVPGARNDMRVVSVEHKLGIHASPTCVLQYGEQGGATGYLVGEPNRGLACMFTMMNHARLHVAIQGLALSESAYQLARSHALERVQGKAPGHEGRVTIVKHPDVRRMLLVMKSQTEAMRAAAYWTASLIDIAHHSSDRESADNAAALVGLLTPIVKGWLTEVAQEVTSLGVQIHGGMGFVEETGAAQYYRDARILPIYEGTTGIQANDLVGRKLLGDDARAMNELIGVFERTVDALRDNAATADLAEPLAAAVSSLERSVRWLLDRAGDDPHAPGSASVNLLMLAGTVLGGFVMARAALAVAGPGGGDAGDPGFAEAKLRTVRFYSAHILPRAAAYASAAVAGASLLMDFPEDAF